MIAVVQQNGLQITILPGFSLDSEQGVFKGQVLYGDEVLTLCVTKERVRQSLALAFEQGTDIEQLFNPASWITQAESAYGEQDPEVYFEEADELGPEEEEDKGS
jgi:Fe-S cluster assembly ATPase SufC